LSEFAAVIGGWGGQLYGVAGGQVVFNLGGGIPAEVLKAFETYGGADPAVNPRVRAVLQAPRTGVVISEPDFISEEDRARHPFYQDFLNQVDTPFVAAASVSTDRRLSVYSAVLRSQTQGPVEEGERTTYANLLPALFTAARTQIRLEAHAAAVAIGSLESLGLPTVLCDFAGRIVATSSQADDMLSSGTLLSGRDGRLRATAMDCDRELQAAMALGASKESAERPMPILLMSADGGEVAVVDVFRLPLHENAFATEARTMIVIGTSKRRSEEVLLRLGLTRAEAEVARLLDEGMDGPAIARLRGASLETVRSQVKAIYAKLGVRRRLELAAKLRRLI
jgi:DNA-binding CsgD family transcriptional regulator